MDSIDVFADSPGELDMCSCGDLQKAQYAHVAGDPHALPKTVIYCLEQGIPVPAWAVPGAVKIMQQSLKTNRKNT